MKTIAIVSGGMDSVTLAHMLASRGHELTLLSFNYGQRHKKELKFAKMCAARIGAQFHLIDLSSVGGLLSGSALTDPSVEVPEGHYASPTMRSTVVANRNAIMLNVAAGVAVAQGAQLVATGVHAGDHAVYPDCRPEFIEAANRSIRVGTEGHSDPWFQLIAPFVNMMKHEICAVGVGLSVPLELTWSCYKGGDVHCGKCGTCYERKEAFALIGANDPTEYEA